MKKDIRLLRILAAAAAAVLFSGCTSVWSDSQTFVMNTILQQSVNGPQEVCSHNEQTARDLENLLSRTLEGSEVFLINHTGGTVEVSTETREVVTASLDAWSRTGGAFDPALGAFRDAWGFGEDEPSVPQTETIAMLLSGPRADDIVVAQSGISANGADIDLGGAAKGYALDAMRAYMTEEAGIQNALISFGGALLVLGHRADGQEWNIGVRDPFSSDAANCIGTFQASDVCIETSGVSEQSFTEDGVTYHHLLDPATGFPADNNLMSVTVTDASGMMADIWSTALFVMGPERGMAFAEENAISALFITRDRRILTSSSFRYTLDEVDEEYTLQ